MPVPANEFACRLYSELHDGYNLFFSPYSIHTCLSMVACGASGETFKEMVDVLSLNMNETKNAKPLNLNSDACKLTTTNAIWLAENVELKQKFVDTLTKQYLCVCEKLNFSNGEVSAKKINDWVEEKTNKCIKDLVKASSFDSDTRVVLTNAIYFKGNWEHPFQESRTKKSHFYTNPGMPSDASIMHQSEQFAYYEDDNLQVLQMMYADDRLAMAILLPREDVMMHLSQKTLDRYLESMTFQRVNVSVPKFKVETSYKLNPYLESIGLKTIFSSEANFNEMCSNEKLCIDAVVHKAFVQVDESGTEAAAATAASMMRCTSVQKSVNFVANRPFTFVIRDTVTEQILFMGDVKKP